MNPNRSKQVGATRESTLPLLAGLNTDHQGRRILALPLWAALQNLGKEGVHIRIREDFLASERLWAALDVFRHVRVLVSCLVCYIRNYHRIFLMYRNYLLLLFVISLEKK